MPERNDAHRGGDALPPLLHELPTSWRALAGDVRRWAAAEGAATAYERAADELESALHAEGDKLVTVAEAAALSGRHPDTIGGAIRDGRLTNHGVKHRPRVRRAELTRVFPPSAIAGDDRSSYDAVADARFLLGTRRGGK
jgi:hypothetical protein